MTDYTSQDEALAASPALDPTPVADVPYTVEQILDMARLPERTARVCFRADLQAEYDRLNAEISTLITPLGEVIEDEETAVGEKSSAARAEEINARIREVRAEMALYTWEVRFRAMASDDWESFVKREKPKNPDADHTTFHSRLICETAVDPQITMEQLLRLKKTLSPVAIGRLIKTAWGVCVEGGVDIPKLPASLRNLGAGSSDA